MDFRFGQTTLMLFVLMGNYGIWILVKMVLTIGGDEDCPICCPESYLDGCDTEEEKQNFLKYRENLIKRWNLKVE